MTSTHTENRWFVLAERPEGELDANTLRLERSEVPKAGKGEMQLQNEYLSLDPYMRGRMSDAPSYADPIALGEVLDEADEAMVFDAVTPARYASALRGLVTSLTSADGKPDNNARDAVRSLVSEIIVSRPDDDGIPIEVRGRLSALISNPEFQVGGAMVAEEGLEPPTRGL